MIVREIRHLFMLAQHRHFGRAAAALGLTQPALSKSVRRLETLYDARLVERGRNGATITAAGEIVLRHARLADRELSLAREQIGAARRGEHGAVVVGASISMAYRLVPQASARCLRGHPGVRLRIVTGLNDVLFSRLQRGNVDLVVSPLPAATWSPDLVHEHLFSDDVHVIARRGHPLSRVRKVTLEKLAGYSWVLYGREVLSTEFLLASFVSAGLPAPEPAIVSDSADYNKEIVKGTDFLSYLPREVLRTELESGAIVALDVPRLAWKRSVGITTRERGTLSPSARLFVEALRPLVREGGRRAQARR